MKKGEIFGIGLAVLLVLGNFVYAQEEKKITDWVNLSWEEMKKILSLDKDEVSLCRGGVLPPEIWLSCNRSCP